MKNTTSPFSDRRANSQLMIQQLVNERTQMLSLYSKLASKHPFIDSESISDLLEQFCQALIDYTADAHFRLYRFIDEKRERRRAVIDVADKVYPKIVSSTQSILDFNDKYDLEDYSEQLFALGDDLSRLGESLADRIELEDQVIDILSSGDR